MSDPEVDAPRPRFAYLLLSHMGERQVEALAQRVLTLSPTAAVVVHHDRAAGAVPWGGRPPARVHLVERRRLAWGSWSIVDATVGLLAHALDELRADWMVVVSGEHWPVTDLAAWEEDVAASGVDALLPCRRLPRRLRFGRAADEDNLFLSRAVHRWRSFPRPPALTTQRAVHGLGRASHWTHPMVKLEFSLRNDAWFVGTPRRRGPVRGWDLYKGSQWVALGRRAATAVLGTDPGVSAWFAASHIPDESYIHTVLHRHGTVDRPGERPLVLADRLVTWVPPQPTRPTDEWFMLRTDQLPGILASGAAFARKVDLVRRPEVVAAIDAVVDAARRPPAGTGTAVSASGVAGSGHAGSGPP